MRKLGLPSESEYRVDEHQHTFDNGERTLGETHAFAAYDLGCGALEQIDCHDTGNQEENAANYAEEQVLEGKTKIWLSLFVYWKSTIFRF